MTDKWKAARAALMLDPAVTNLNTGSWGPLPRPVFERVTELRRRLAEEPMDFFLRYAPPLLWQARERLAEFVGGDPHRLVFTANVSCAINLVAASLVLASPGDILLTDHEYGAMHWCWERAAQRQGLNLRTFPLPTMAEDPGAIVEAFVRAMTPRTRLLFFSHVVSSTGLVLPVREICAEARRRGILTMVDGAHAPAMVPLNLKDIGCDFYGANCHKWLLAPTGAGLLYLGEGNEDRLQPLQVSWGWHRDVPAHPLGAALPRSRDDRDVFGTTPRLRFYEFEGTRDICPWLAVPTAIDFQQALGWQDIRARNELLVRHARQRLGMRLPPATPEHPRLHGFLTAFCLPQEADGARIRQQLWERFRIEAPLVERPERLLLRVSTHFYNTEVEIDRLREALDVLL